MKKTLLIIMGVALMIGATSCKKDGVYNPKKKISKIYVDLKSTTTISATGTSTTTTNPKHLAEEWIWDGNLLKEVRNYNADGEIEATTTYTYDGKQLIRIDNQRGDVNSYATFTYDGKWLKSSEFYYDGRLNTSHVYTHTDKKITSYEETQYSYGLDKNELAKVEKAYNEIMQPVGMIVPETSLCVASKGQVERKKTVELTWTGNNLTTIVTKIDGSSSAVGCTYDDKKNPYYGLFEQNYTCAPGMVSENNLITSTSSDSPLATYTYDGKYPVTRTLKSSTTTQTGSLEVEMTYTFEYK